jgi:hypothetical protein
VVRGFFQFFVVHLPLLYVHAHISVSFISGVGVKASYAGWIAMDDTGSLILHHQPVNTMGHSPPSLANQVLGFGRAARHVRQPLPSPSPFPIILHNVPMYVYSSIT